MSNAYVFEGTPADDDGGLDPDEGGNASSPIPFALLLVTALILAAVIVLLLVRCCDGSESPRIAVAAFVAHVDAPGVVR